MTDRPLVRPASVGRQERKCPKCLEIRNRSSETEEETQRYQAWVTKHHAPAAQKRLAELEKEMREYINRNQASN